jgi:predicted cupin superfamily sugar epimerase
MTADELIEFLQLKPHPKEDGFFVETYRSDIRYPDGHSASTAIYFLLKSYGFSEVHRLSSDEIFHFYSGAPAEALLLYSNGEGSRLHLGNDLLNGERPQIVVPAGTWQGWRTTGEFTLMGCTVAPGFEFSDYESGNRENLIKLYPKYEDLIRQLTRPAR